MTNREPSKLDTETSKVSNTQNPNATDVINRTKFPSISPSRKLYLRLSNTLLSLKGELHKDATYELETGTAFNFTPVMFAVGIAIYFTIPSEPNLVALALTCLILHIVSRKLNIHGQGYFSLVAIAFVFTGMLAAKINTNFHGTPVIERQITSQLTGMVIGIDQNSRGSPRYIVKPINIEKLAGAELPLRLRVSASSKHEEIKPGDILKGLVRLQPVSGPVYPDGYDFSFFAWFNDLGGSGFFMGAPQKFDAQHQIDLKTSFGIKLNKFRKSIEARIARALPKPASDIAIALVTGNKTGIPNDIQESLRATGLAHILAISGLHMALVTLTVIWCLRAIFAFFPAFILKFPTKKIAVAIGFFSATFYLLISGGGIATQRAWIMISVMLLAVIMDKRAITMRSVAISALIILAINPQSLFSPGFQMSFAAVASLVAGYEYLNKRRRIKAENDLVPIRQSKFLNAYQKVSVYFGGIAITSLIAGTATGFIAAWHFHQVALLGLFANVLAMPIVTTIVMPFVLASLLLMPYGLEFIALAPVAFGIELVVEISRYIETFTPAKRVGIQPELAVIIFGLFLTILTIPKTKLRFLSLGMIPALFFIPGNSDVPDILVAENGRAIAVKASGDQLALLNTRSGSFVTGIWEKAWSTEKLQKIKLSKEQCSRERCIYVMPNSDILHIVYNPDLIQSSCQRADILIAPRLWWINCKTRQPNLILKRYDFEQRGTHALYADAKQAKNSNSNTYRIETALPDHKRPWHRNVRPIDEVRSINGTGG